MQNKNDNFDPLKAFVASHFMFNVLSKLQAEILKDNKKEAINTLTIYSKLLRLTYKISENSIITLDEEKLFIENYLKLEQMRFEGFYLDFKIDGFNTKKRFIKPFSIQTFVEFAVLSGIGHPTLLIEIIFDENEKSISINSEIENYQISDKITEKCKIAEQRLIANKYRYEIKQSETRYLQKIYLNNEK